MPEQEVREYRQGDVVRLTVELQDNNGVRYALAVALLEGEKRGDAPGDRKLELDGWPEEPTNRLELVLTGTVEQQKPGLYFCYAVVAENDHQALSRHGLDPPLQLRIVEHQDDVREGPEVLSVGTFW